MSKLPVFNSMFHFVYMDEPEHASFHFCGDEHVMHKNSTAIIHISGGWEVTYPSLDLYGNEYLEYSDCYYSSLGSTKEVDEWFEEQEKRRL